MLVTSRSFAEYAAMFDLRSADLTGRVMDCCAGGSSFVAEAHAAGHDVVAVDPSYAMPRAALLQAVGDSALGTKMLIDDHADRFLWDWYGGSQETRTAIRAEAAAAFIKHITDLPQRYLAGALPRLPFADGSVDLLLCSHLLFTWSDRYDEDWHRRALIEMIRVAAQVRIFPLVVQGTGEPVPYVDRLRRELAEHGSDTEVRTVPFEFQRGANTMLVIETNER